LKAVGNDVQMATGVLQTCAEIQSEIEAAMHAMITTFKEEECEAVILVDMDNALHCLNRKVVLHNISKSSPYLYQYLYNGYKAVAKLHIGDGTHILSEEGVTQGDNLAMAKYALGTRNLISSLAQGNNEVRQVWFADDSASGGKLSGLKKWWDDLNQYGPAYGYFPKASKTVLILKNPELLERAKEMFGNGEGEITITTEGKRHIGAVIGTEEFKEQYVKDKVEKWVKDVKQLADIAKEDPQAALSAYNTGISQRWKFIQRTVPKIEHLFEQLENSISTDLIPALCGRSISELERKIFALPYRYGGMGILNPVATSDPSPV
jgi:hypothetical protein